MIRAAKHHHRGGRIHGKNVIPDGITTEHDGPVTNEDAADALDSGPKSATVPIHDGMGTSWSGNC